MGANLTRGGFVMNNFICHLAGSSNILDVSVSIFFG